MKNKFNLVFAVALLSLIASPLSAQRRNSSTTVATVRGDAISLEEIQRREALLTRNRPAQEGSEELRRLAIRHAIRERVLLQGAAAEGVAVTDSEVTDFVSEMQRSSRDAGATEAIAAFRSAAEALVLTEDEFPRDSRVIEAYRRLMVLGRMRKLLVDRLPAVDRERSTAMDDAVDLFVANHSDDVVILDAK